MTLASIKTKLSRNAKTKSDAIAARKWKPSLFGPANPVKDIKKPKSVKTKPLYPSSVDTHLQCVHGFKPTKDSYFYVMSKMHLPAGVLNNEQLNAFLVPSGYTALSIEDLRILYGETMKRAIRA